MAAIPPPYATDEHEQQPTGTAGEAPPDYDGDTSTSQWAPSAGINDRMPSIFRVNKIAGPAFVLPSDLQAHLILLGAFHRLREQVRTQKGKLDIPLEPDEAWAVFLQRAVYRFEQWVKNMVCNDGSGLEEPRHLAPRELPPLDVTMVWHTFMLNPRTYLDDCKRVHHGLYRIGSFPLVELCTEIDHETLLPRPATESRVAAFSAFTGQPFEPPLRTTSDETISLSCPACSEPCPVPWITYKGEGYAQRNFSILCSVCQFHLKRETIGVCKFYVDMEKCVKSPSEVLANTLVDWHTGVAMPELARQLTSIILKLDDNPPALRPKVAGTKFGWKFTSIEKICRSGFLGRGDIPEVPTPRVLNIILSAYRQPGPFSIDLGSAVMRQMSFIDKMDNFGWTADGRFEDDNETLTRAAVRYHAFLDLMSGQAGSFIVPTLDIDLAWHTHQLLCKSYRDLEQVLGMVPDHDDKVAQGPLSIAYDQTAEAWKEKFGVPYSVCGCLPPSAKFESSASSILARFKGKTKAQPLKNVRPDLVSDDDMHADNTHPSDHNSVAFFRRSIESQEEEQSRRRELAKRAKDISRKADKGVGGEWVDVLANRVPEHKQAFLAPVDYGVIYPFGKYGRGDRAVYSGAGTSGVFGAGNCAKGSGQLGVCGADIKEPRFTIKDSVGMAVAMSGDKQRMKECGVTSSSATFLMYGGTIGGCGGGGCGGGTG